MKWIRDINGSSETVKLLTENRGKLLDFGLGDDSLARTLKPQATKAQIRKRDDITLKFPRSGRSSPHNGKAADGILRYPSVRNSYNPTTKTKQSK